MIYRHGIANIAETNSDEGLCWNWENAFLFDVKEKKQGLLKARFDSLHDFLLVIQTHRQILAMTYTTIKFLEAGEGWGRGVTKLEDLGPIQHGHCQTLVIKFQVSAY